MTSPFTYLLMAILAYFCLFILWFLVHTIIKELVIYLLRLQHKNKKNRTGYPLD
jgi:hypothetical protein